MLAGLDAGKQRLLPHDVKNWNKPHNPAQAAAYIDREILGR
jgi:hypothetical protein